MTCLSATKSNSGFSAELPVSFAPEARTLPALLVQQAERHGDKRLIVVNEVARSFNDACKVAAQVAASLYDAGVRPGDAVTIICSNRIEFIDIYLGCAWLGAVAVPVNVASRGSQLEHILNNSVARLLVVEAQYLSAITGLGDKQLSFEKIWTIGKAETGAIFNVPCIEMPLGTEERAAHPSRPSDTVAILYTSGTTGLSKGVCCPHAQYYWWGINTATLLDIGETDILLTCLPLFHTNALNTFYQALLTGATLVVEPRFSASGFWKSLARHQATVTYLLGAMVPILLSKDASPDDQAHQTRITLAPGVPAQFHDAFTNRFGIEILDGYGSTETNFAIGSLLGEQRPGSMGRIRPGFQARVVDAMDNQVPDGQPGELVIRADEPFSMATGYFGMPEKTVEAWQNLWFHTGDRVVRDADGYFQFIDRMKDAIRRRGENISSFEVEQVLVGHPSVRNAAVFPVQSELAEDEVMAAIVLKEGVALQAAELLDFCQPRMPYFAVPRFVEFVEELPTTENGKVQKFKLRERGVTENTWDRDVAGYKVTR
ncbi:ATP-dependent acyl-CoA ligase [Rhizobium sp. KVB221]|uniref:ATP-dependent acyl-CoA ligase n=2 Tax=Rhizobium setariae TaxID=2801340 RepID=A0A936YUQ1_9HYPH|nr:ATP-dependent acyl-CoA ligase [Rhizobium setariae]